MKYIILLVLVLAVSAKKSKQEFNSTKITNGGTYDKNECLYLYQYGFNYLAHYCDQINHLKRADETFCMMLSSNEGAAYSSFGQQVCHELYTCENYNDDSVLFMIERVFGEKLPIPGIADPMESGRGMHYWFTEGAKFMKTLTDDKCQSLAAALR